MAGKPTILDREDYVQLMERTIELVEAGLSFRSVAIVMRVYHEAEAAPETWRHHVRLWGKRSGWKRNGRPDIRENLKRKEARLANA